MVECNTISFAQQCQVSFIDLYRTMVFVFWLRQTIKFQCFFEAGAIKGSIMSYHVLPCNIGFHFVPYFIEEGRMCGIFFREAMYSRVAPVIFVAGRLYQ